VQEAAFLIRRQRIRISDVVVKSQIGDVDKAFEYNRDVDVKNRYGDTSHA